MVSEPNATFFASNKRVDWQTFSFSRDHLVRAGVDESRAPRIVYPIMIMLHGVVMHRKQTWKVT